MLLEIAPSVFEQSLAACHAGVIDSTTLNSGLDYFLQPCLLFVLIGVVQYLCEEIVFSIPGSHATTSSTPLPGSSAGQSMLSPAGRAISPLATRGGKPGNGNPSSGEAGQGKSAASVLMLQTSLKSLLAGESFPFRLVRLLRSEISAALESLATESDHQMGIIQDRLAEATVNYYRKPALNRSKVDIAANMMGALTNLLGCIIYATFTSNSMVQLGTLRGQQACTTEFTFV